MMYAWFMEYGKDFAASAGVGAPATDAELQLLEEETGLRLSPAHRAFLSLCNGAKSWGAHGQIYSTQDILQAYREWGFAPWSGQVQLLGPAESHYYSQRPAHFLMVAQHPLGADCYCLDTRPGAGEWPVCRYDAENTLEQNLRPRFADFESFLLSELETVLEETEDEALLEDELLWERVENWMYEAEQRDEALL